MSDSISKESIVIHEDEPVYRRFSASLRIFGGNLDFDEFSRTLELTPTHSHRKGTQRSPR